MAEVNGTRAVRVSLTPGVGGSAAASAPMVVEPPADRTAGPSLAFLDPERAILTRAPERPERVRLVPLARPRPVDRSATERSATERWEVVVGGWRFEVEVEDAVRAALRERASRDREAAGHAGPTAVHAIIPGVVVSVAVAAGDAVAAGQQLLAVEAMKMQNELRAPRAGVVERVAVAAGATIEVGDLLVVIA